jgi:hypothetical protein
VRMIPVGELDLATTPQLRDQLDELIHAGSPALSSTCASWSSSTQPPWLSW